MPTETKTISEDCAGQRLDRVLASLWPEYSRAKLQQWLKAGDILVDDAVLKGKVAVKGGETVVLSAELGQAVLQDVAEPIDLDIIYEDDDVLVINKAAGMVVHPGAGNATGTLLNALLYHCPVVSQLPRAGIVHRLDKETTGLMMIAKTLVAQTALVGQLQARTVKRTYDAIVVGVMTAGRTIDEPIGRHPQHRTKMAVIEPPYGKEAVTHLRVLQRFDAHTHVEASLETGRTHQIRVHCAHCRYPLVGDPVYGGRLHLPVGASEALQQALKHFKRQALHAKRLQFIHPVTHAEMDFSAALPADMQTLISLLSS